jgi:hypothetical protein
MRKFLVAIILCATCGFGITPAAAAPSNVSDQRVETAQRLGAPSGLGDTTIAVFGCGAAQSTLITPNSQALVTSLQNANNQILIAFSTGGVTYWTVMLSTSVVSVALSSNRGNAIVTFQAGLKVYLVANGAAGFNIFLSGEVIDDGTTYKLTGTYLGTFKC